MTTFDCSNHYTRNNHLVQGAAESVHDFVLKS